MKYITIRDFRTKPGQVRESLAGEDALLTQNGKPFALVTPVTPSNYMEVSRAVKQAKAQTLLRAIRADAALKGTDRLSATDIEREIAAARKERSTTRRRTAR